MSLIRHCIYELAESSIGHRTFSKFRGRGSPIFMFHRVLEPGEPCYAREMVTTVPMFKRFLEWLQAYYQVVPLSVLADHLGDPQLCSITFDDGWEDNYRHAFPLLKQVGMPATIYLISSYIGTCARLWQDDLWRCCERLNRTGPFNELNEVANRLPWCPMFGPSTADFWKLRGFLLKRSSREAKEFVRFLCERVGIGDSRRPSFMDWDEVKEMSRHGITFGSHTVTHNRLTQTTIAEVATELRESRRELEHRLGRRVDNFAYPWGAVNRWVRHCVKEAGYKTAVTVSETYAVDSNDTLTLPRIFLSDSILAHNGEFRPGKVDIHLARMSTRRNSQNRATLNALPVRISIIIDEIDTWQGGTEQQFRKTLEVLSKPEFNVDIYVLRHTAALRDAELPFPVKILDDHPKGGIATTSSLFKHLRRRRPEIVHTFFPDSNVYGTLAAKLVGVPVVINARRSLGYWQRWRDRMLLKISNRFVDRWQCNSRTVRDWLCEHEHVPAESIDILPNVIDLTQFEPPGRHERNAARQRLRIPDSALVITSVANLRPVKRLDTLVQAMGILVPQLPNAHVLLVGEGECETGIRRQAERLGVSSNIRFEGRQPDVRPYLAAADIGVLTSSSEGASNSLLEYMAMALPAVVSDIPANQGLVSEVWFAMGDAKDLANKIMELLRDPRRCERMRSEYRRSAEEYGAAQFAMRVQSFYFSLISESIEY